MIFVGLLGLILLAMGLVMVLSSAFKHRFNWGMAILLLPVIAPVYGIYNWREHQARNGLFTVIIGLFVVAAALYGGVGRDIATLFKVVPSEQVQQHVKEIFENIPEAGPPDKPLPNQAAANKVQSKPGTDYDPIHGDDEFAYTKIEPLPPDDDVRVVVPEQTEVIYEYQVITAAQAGNFINKQLKVATKKGEPREGKLIRSDEDSLYLESVKDGGIVQFQYAFENIDALLVYEAKGVVAAMNAPAIQVNTSEPSASTSQDTPELSALKNHEPSDAHDAKAVEQASPVQGGVTTVTNADPSPSPDVSAPVPAESSAQTAEPSPQADQADAQTVSVTPAAPSSSAEATRVAPASDSSTKPVIYIKSKPSSIEEHSTSAQQPESATTQSNKTAVAVPNPATSADAPTVQ